jgi:hypothetical protein
MDIADRVEKLIDGSTIGGGVYVDSADCDLCDAADELVKQYRRLKKCFALGNATATHLNMHRMLVDTEKGASNG